MSGIINNLLVVANGIKSVMDGDQESLNINSDIISKGKITKFASKFLISPMIIVDENLKYMDAKKLKNIVKTEMATFTGVVSQSFRYMVEVYGVEPKIVIDSIGSPSGMDRISDINAITNLIAGDESNEMIHDTMYGDGIIGIGENSTPVNTGSKISNNNYIQKDVSSFINTYEVQLDFTDKEGNKRVMVIPLIVYPNIVYTNSETFIRNMVDGDANENIIERTHDYMAGLISFTDLILATDLVKKYKDRKFKNSNDMSTYLNTLDKTTTIRDVLHNRKHFHKNYNIYVFSESIRPTLESLIRGSILKDSYKDKLTDLLSAFSVTFVDPDNEELTMLLDSIPGFTTLSFEMLSKEKESDIGTVLKELSKNSQPF